MIEALPILLMAAAVALVPLIGDPRPSAPPCGAGPARKTKGEATR